jgi:cation:H+ antiporter
MTFPVASVVFAACLVVSLGASFVLARGLDRIGARLGVTDGVLGIMTALGADSPEIATAAAAVVAHQHDIGVGVVLGSNIFNLAGLLGLGAVISGAVRIGRRATVLEGSAAIAVAVIAVLVVTGALPPVWSLAVSVLVLAPYVWLASLRPVEITHGQAHVGGIRRPIARAVAEGQRGARPDHRATPARTADVLAVVVALVVVVAASTGMVHAAIDIGRHLHVSGAVMGTLVLAFLTSIPNAVAAVRLALHRRGSAVVSEAFSSNSANVVAGLCLPAALLGLGTVTGVGRLTAWWALGMTVLACALLLRHRGLGRRGGMAVIASYGVFVVVLLNRV